MVPGTYSVNICMNEQLSEEKKLPCRVACALYRTSRGHPVQIGELTYRPPSQVQWLYSASCSVSANPLYVPTTTSGIFPSAVPEVRPERSILPWVHKVFQGGGLDQNRCV